jgi:hypothetical protein
MVIAKLQGGLGNQMFQYAAARGFAGDQEPVYLDHTALEKNSTDNSFFTARKYELGIFKNLKCQRAHAFPLNIIADKTFIFKLSRTIIPPRIIKDGTIPDDQFFHSKYNYLDGYFQSESYFKDKRALLLSEFSFPESDNIIDSLKSRILSTDNPVALHVRRGDYLKPDVAEFHGVLPLAYYQRAKKKIESVITSAHYFVFSDDIEWCKHHFSFLGHTVTFVATDTLRTWQDMYLMSLCRHHIIANSSYSWWSAWLNKTPEKIVIAPENWFANESYNNQTDIVPRDWVKL